MKRLAFFAIASAFCLSANIGFSTPHLMSANITLQGGSIGPKGSLYIKKDQLIKGVAYDVNCQVIPDSPTSGDQFFIRIPVLTSELGQHSSSCIDGIQTHYNGQGALKFSYGQRHSISINHVYKSSRNFISADHAYDIVVQNLDQTRSIQLSHCTALPSTEA